MKYFTLVVFLFLPFFVQAQFEDDAELACGSSELISLRKAMPFAGDENKIFDYLADKGYFSENNADFVKYRVPLKFWVYTKRDGSGNLGADELKQFMIDLNYYNELNKTGFRYYIRDIKYIRKNRHANMGYFLEAPWQSIVHKDKGAINIFMAASIKKGETTVRGTYNQVTHAVLTKKRTSPTSLAHEIGHYFGLLHPHRGYKGNKCQQEAVDRTRVYKGCLLKKGRICEHSGDKLCDTPAEPRLSLCVSRDCQYTGTTKDRWGQLYVPDIDNIMSYPTYRRCRTKFTPGQVAVMLYTAEHNKYASSWETSKNNVIKNPQFNADVFEPDNEMQMASTILGDSTQTHSFHSIFTGKKKTPTKDNEDWLQFTIYSFMKNKAEFDFRATNTNFPKIEVTIFNADNNQISKHNLDANNQQPIILKDLPLGKYYVKIKSLENSAYSEYKVKYIN
jgi:hypothetical protein